VTAPAWVLFVLAPLVGELMSGSMPPAEWLNPLSIVTVSVLYGGGAIMCRELAVRWRKGWPTFLALGIAYGIVEEGLLCKSFFDPGWGDIGPFGVYGRWGGVNWVWTAGLTGFHAVWSVASSVVLVELAFPARRGSWITDRAFAWLAGLFMLDVVAGHLLLTKYRPPAVHVLVTVAVTAGLIALARRLSAPRRTGRAFSPAVLFWLAFAWAVGWFGVFWICPERHVAAGWTLAVLGSLAAAGIWGYARWAAVPSPRHRFALASGVLFLFILLAPVQEFDKRRTDNPRGMAAVGLAAGAGLLWLSRRIGRRAGA